LKTIKRRLKTDEVTKVLFRDKTRGWHNYFINISTTAGSTIRRSEQDLFYRAYFDNVLLSKSCMDCLLRQKNSLADIRLGDFWGIDYQKREDGVTAILLLSDAGQEILNKLDTVNIMSKFETIDFLQNQSTHRYETMGIQKDAIDCLKTTNNLSRTIRLYRKKLPLKKRCHLYLKNVASCLPNKIYVYLRNNKNHI